jgi:tetratricopeptide (TPR) repeat protein
LKVGISWKGGTKRTRQQARSIPLELWRPILELAGVRFVSLQYGDVKAEIDEANEGLSRPIAQFAREEIDDFDQLAGLVGALDLVISVQTSLVHLSGALGQACWVMVPHVAEWRYGAEGNSMPWYSSVRLYRQTMRSEWGETLARVAGDLIALAAAPAAKETEPVSVSVETRYREALAAYEARRLDESEGICQEILTRQRDHFDAAHLLGIIQLQSGRMELAEQQLRSAVQIRPQQAIGHNSLGIALKELGRMEEALACFETASRIEPRYVEALINRGAALHALGRFEEAVATYDQAIALRQSFAAAYSNRGNALAALGRYEEAISSYDRAIASQPDYADAFYGRGLSELMLRRFAPGWDDAEHRWRSSDFRSDCRADVDGARLALRLDRGDVRNRRVLVVAEQGVGDEIMFASMIPDLVREAGEVAVECDRRLAALFGRSFPGAAIIPRGSMPRRQLDEFDHLLPAGSLGRLYRNTLAEFPDRRSYLKPDEAIVARWQSRLAGLGSGLKVGISWKGGSERTRRPARSIPLELWRPILEQEGARFVSLQYGDVTTEVDRANEGLSRPIAHFAPEEIDDFDQLAGLVGALDLVISVQTAVVHLSGALGQPCWVMVPHIGEWRYGAEGKSMPWYSSVRLYRQTTPAHWGETIVQIREALGGRTGSQIGPNPMAEFSVA